MSITRRTDYAVRLMYELAQIPVGASLSLRDLCEVAEVPDAFGSSLVAFLVDAGMVCATGYREHLLSLARPASEIAMAEIIRACEPEFSLSQCSREPEVCNRSARCGVHKMWLGLDSLVWQQLDMLTLERVATGKAALCDVPVSRLTAGFNRIAGPG